MSTYLEQLLGEAPEKEGTYLEKIEREAREEEESRLLAPGLNPNDPRSYVAQAVMEAPGEIKRIAQGAKEMVMNPIDTFANAVRSIGGAAQALTGQEVPGSPQDEAFKAVAGQVEEVVEDPLRAVVQNPISTLTAVSGLPGLRAVEPLGAAGRMAQTGAKKFARNETRKTLGLPRVDKDLDITGIVDTALGRRVDMTPEGYDLLYGKLEGPTGKRKGGVIGRIEDDMNTMIKQADDRGEMVSVPSIDKHLAGLEDSLKGTDGGDAARAAIQQMRGNLFNEFENRLFIKPSELQKFKINIGKQVYERKSDIARRFETETQVKEARRKGAREQIERVAPEMKGLNKEWADLARLEPWMAKGINRISEMEPGFQKMASGILQNPQTRAKIAQWVDRIHRGNASGIEKALNSREIRIAMILASQAQGAEQ
jgi:hypothetical protein